MVVCGETGDTDDVRQDDEEDGKARPSWQADVTTVKSGCKGGDGKMMMKRKVRKTKR
jgi:hypothetical protein